MPVRREDKITTEDPRAVKRERLEKALANPKYADWPHRKIAIMLGVDESMVRRYRAKQQPAKKPAGRKKAKAKPKKLKG